MSKFLLIFFCTCLLACNNQSAPEKKENKTSTSPTVLTSLSTESEMEILAECVDNAKDKSGNDLDDTKAFTYCRCILRQMQEKYPNADSVALVNHLTDTAEVRQMALKCH